MKINGVNKEVAFRFLGKVIEAEVLGSHFNEEWGRECYDLRMISGDHIGRTLTVPADFTFASAEDAKTKLHIGNKVQYMIGDTVSTATVLKVLYEDGCYEVRDDILSSEIFWIAFGDVDMAQKSGIYLCKDVKGFRASKGA